MKAFNITYFAQLLSLQSPGFRRNLFTLISGTTIAQVLGLLFIPVLTRLYSPEAFGYFGIFYAVICVLGVLSTWRLELAVVLPEKVEEARQIWKVTLFLTIATSMVFGLILAPTLEVWDLGHLGKMEIWVALTLGLFLIGFMEALMQWHNRLQHYGILATKNVLERVSVIVASVVFAYMNRDLSGLIWAQIVALILCAAYLLLKTYPDSPMRQPVKLANASKLVRSYRDFPLIQGWSMLFLIGATQVPNILFGSFFTMADTGHVNLAYRILEAPVNLFAVSFATTFYQHISQLSRLEIERLFRKSILMLVKWVMPIFILAGITSPFIFPLLFGEEWKTAGAIAGPLALVSFVKIMYLSHSAILLVLRRLDIDLKISASFMLAQLIGFFGTYMFTHSIVTIVLVMSLLTTAALLAGLYLIYKEIQRPEDESVAGARLGTAQ